MFPPTKCQRVIEVEDVGEGEIGNWKHWEMLGDLAGGIYVWLHPVVHNQIWTYQSETGKKAMSVVAQRLNTLEEDIEECTTWVAIWFMRTAGLMTHLGTLYNLNALVIEY
ncbi:hypothetical protein BT96DRAFT_947344 [Gymnopus androsaceus JB14]|uniref:Uncharacterized protein n=1 Tax=Gymnopus androsaceus JB14 TaxID=1447944 RepID=A0A6A4GSK7_9AGAR|nr:hypothetical protein BT96DRAFT_947344 [Gymnopus androsaceus JB14]